MLIPDDKRSSAYLVVVGFVGEELWTHVVRRPDEGAGHVVLVLQHSCNAKVANFDDVGLGQEDVLRLQVAVENVPLVQVLRARISRMSRERVHCQTDFPPHYVPGAPWRSGQTTPPPGSQAAVPPSAA